MQWPATLANAVMLTMLICAPSGAYSAGSPLAPVGDVETSEGTSEAGASDAADTRASVHPDTVPQPDQGAETPNADHGAPPDPGDFTSGLDDLNLDDLMNLHFEAASSTARDSSQQVIKPTQREAPGVVTLLTREDLVRAGVRDLIDVLMLVPGFQVGADR